MATTTTHQIGSWDTFHNNGPFETTTLYKTTLEGKGNMPSLIDRYNDAATEIQRLIKIALDNQEGLKPYGSAWSMNHIAHGKDSMHYNAEMNLKKAVASNELHANTDYKADNLFFFQCGNVIKEISKFLFDHGKSIKATGASNGQTIAGCISTGVHGSAFNEGAMQECVVGLNLIIGENNNDIVYLERHTKPALNNEFATQINAKVIRNDGLFNAALVGLGAFGFIHGVVIEVEDRFLLKRYVKKISKEKAMELGDTMDFVNSDFVIDNEVDDNGLPNHPFHYKMFINPYSNEPDYVVELMYKKLYRTDYPDPIPRIKTAIYRDLIILFIKIAERFKNSIPKIIKLLQTSVLPKTDVEVTGTLAEMFWDAPYQGPAFACSLGIDHTNSSKALELMMELARNEGPIPGIFAMRFVKQSKATLAFTKFPITCMLEIDGLLWKPKRNNMITLENFCTRVIEAFQAENIPFTLHWGKNADWAFPDLVNHMYGNKANTWKEYRSALLTKEVAAVFNNKFLNDTGLSEYLDDIPANLVESMD